LTRVSPEAAVLGEYPARRERNGEAHASDFCDIRQRPVLAAEQCGDENQPFVLRVGLG
jgi:hypothetical protein